MKALNLAAMAAGVWVTLSAAPALALSYVTYMTDVNLATSIVYGYGDSTQLGYSTLPLFNPALGKLVSVELTGTTIYGYSASWDTRIATSGVEFYGVGVTQSSAAIYLPDYSLAFEPLMKFDDKKTGTVEAGEMGSLVVGPIDLGQTSDEFITWSEALEAFTGVGTGKVEVQAGLLTYRECFTANRCGTFLVSAYEKHRLGVTYGYEAAAVPEPAAWALMLLGFGSAGALLRLRSRVRVES